MKKIILAAFAALVIPAAANAQLTAANYPVAIANSAVINCQTATTNLPASLLVTNTIPNGKTLGIGLVFSGQSSTNTGVIGFQFQAVYGGTGNILSTTKTFTVTSTANGTTPVNDWVVVPNSTFGPVNGLVLTSITNAAVNVNGSYTDGGVLVSNVYVQYGTSATLP